MVKTKIPTGHRKLTGETLPRILSRATGSARMSPYPEPEIIFSHESDLDGFLSGCLLQRLCTILYDREVPLEPLSASPWTTLKRFPERAWVSDLSFSPAIDRKGWMVIDHHITDCSPDKALLVHREGHSATRLCYELLEREGGGNEKLARLVDLTDITDLYLHDHPEFPLACEYARLVKTYHFRPLYRLLGNRMESLLDHPLLQIMNLKQKVEDPVGLEWSRHRIKEIAPGIGFVPTAVGDVNRILHELLRDESLPYSTLFAMFKRPGRPVTLSIRSLENGEALHMARSLQGGGHPDAAGAVLPRSVGTFDCALVYLTRQLQPHVAFSAGSTEKLFKDAGL